MKKYKFNKNFSIFFIGIGGISQSALAIIMLKSGCKVAGSDVCISEITKKLESLGAKIRYNQAQVNLTGNENLVVFSGAIKETCPDILFAKEHGIEVISRAEFLNVVAAKYKNVIAVAGTHGKTTTTAMLAEIFIAANKKPTVHIGGEVINFNGNVVIGKRNYFITEACEYKNSFNKLWPSTAIVTNVEKEHLDCYRSFVDLKKAFVTFLNKANHVVVAKGFNKNLKCKNVISVALKGANFSARNIKFENGLTYFDCFYNGEFYYRFTIYGTAKYNVKNALFAIATAHIYKLKKEHMFLGLQNFLGVKRRNETIGQLNKSNVVADYAHHPTEIKNFLESKGNLKNCLVIFQPHTFTRTKNLFNEFLSVLNTCSNIIIYKTYSARENSIIGGREVDLFNELKSENKLLCLSEVQLKNAINEMENGFTEIYVLGAGDIYEIVRRIL